MISLEAPRRRLAGVFVVPIGLQAVLYQLLLGAGYFYREPHDCMHPKTVTIVDKPDLKVTTKPLYCDYGFFGPYFGIDVMLETFVVVALIVGVVGAVVLEIYARRGPLGWSL